MAITKIEVPELFDFGSDNSAFKLPTGTTAERPTSPSNGEMRFNTTTGYVEYYDTTDAQWWEIDYAPDPFVPTDNFNPVIYTGNGGTQTISTVGFQPDLVWTKQRNGTAFHMLIDSVRGNTKEIYSNSSATEGTSSNTIASFLNNGYSIGNNGGLNGANNTYVSWNWKAGGNSNTFNVNGTGYSTASAAGLTTGSLTPTGASVNTANGFSIITLNSGSSTADVTVSHGLGVKPSFVLFKKLNGEGGAWFTWSAGLSPESYYLYLSDDYGVGNLTQSSNAWGNQSFTSDVISFRSGWTVETNRNVVIYAWAEISGYSKMGSYTGTGVAGNTVVTGFRPAFVMLKRTDSANDWNMFDNKRSTSNPINDVLRANLSNAESVNDTYLIIDFLSNGFELGGTSGGTNANGGTYIYMAFAAT